MTRGIITDFNYFEILLNYIFKKQLEIDEIEHHAIITETSFNPKKKRELLTELMFEKFNVPFFFIGNDALFSLYSSGKTNGTVFQSGSSVSCSVPILNGNSIKDAIIKIPIGGVDISKYLMKLIGEPK